MQAVVAGNSVHVVANAWTNSENEILKLGVIKYGLANWAKVASMLPRKSAAQCRMRWFEFIAPEEKNKLASVGSGNEWSVVEDMNLIKLVKTYRNQWQTITDEINKMSKPKIRTAAQCMKRTTELIEKFGDKLEGTENNNSNTLKNQTILPSATAGFNVRESKRDLIDLSNEELEMQQEARMRIANSGLTRKEKKRQKEEILANKRRELKRFDENNASTKTDKKASSAINNNIGIIKNQLAALEKNEVMIGNRFVNLSAKSMAKSKSGTYQNKYFDTDTTEALLDLEMNTESYIDKNEKSNWQYSNNETEGMKQNKNSLTDILRNNKYNKNENKNIENTNLKEKDKSLSMKSVETVIKNVATVNTKNKIAEVLKNFNSEEIEPNKEKSLTAKLFDNENNVLISDGMNEDEKDDILKELGNLYNND